MSGLRLVVFDCDGTLVDSQHAIGHCMKIACEKAGIPYPGHEAVKSVVGLSLHDAAKRLLPSDNHHLAEDLIEGYKSAFFELRASGNVHEPLFPKVLETLESLERENILMGVATGKSHRGLVKTLEGHGLSRFFVTLQTSDFHPGKPHPSMLEKAMQETGVVPEKTIIIGDTTFDIEMGRNAGVEALGVSWGYHDPKILKESGAKTILEGMDEVVHHALRL